MHSQLWPLPGNRNTGCGKNKKKTCLSWGLRKRKLLFRTILLINPEQPERVKGLFIPVQNLGCISQEEEAENRGWQHRLTFSYPNFSKGCFPQFPFQKAPTGPAELTASLWPWDAVADLTKWKRKLWVCVQQINSRTESPDHRLPNLATNHWHSHWLFLLHVLAEL